MNNATSKPVLNTASLLIAIMAAFVADRPGRRDNIISAPCAGTAPTTAWPDASRPPLRVNRVNQRECEQNGGRHPAPRRLSVALTEFTSANDPAEEGWLADRLGHFSNTLAGTTAQRQDHSR